MSKQGKFDQHQTEAAIAAFVDLAQNNSFFSGAMVTVVLEKAIHERGESPNERVNR